MLADQVPIARKSVHRVEPRAAVHREEVETMPIAPGTRAASTSAPWGRFVNRRKLGSDIRIGPLAGRCPEGVFSKLAGPGAGADDLGLQKVPSDRTGRTR